MKQFLYLALFFSFSAFSADDFPTAPNELLTPGSLCDHPTAIRYPEQIPYCARNVNTEAKKKVIKIYDSQLGYQIEKMDRQEFKIDHYIPLCMGGANDIKNLWPQHESVYKYTDRLEELSCKKMAEGKLLQKEAIEIMKRAKANLPEAEKLEQYVISL